MASAEALAQASYGNAAQRNDQQKSALLDAVAQAGAAGKAAYDKAGQTIGSQRQAAIDYAAAAPASGGRNLLSQVADPGMLENGHNVNGAFSTLSDVNATAGAALEGDTARLGQNIGDYYGQLNAAIPLEQSRAQSQANQIIADLRDKQATQQYNRQMQQMQMDAAKAALTAKGKTPEQEAQFQSDYLSNLSTSYGPKVNAIITKVLANAKDLPTALAALHDLENQSNGFTQDVMVKDQYGQPTGQVSTASKGLQADVLSQLIQDYFASRTPTAQTPTVAGPYAGATASGSGKLPKQKKQTSQSSAVNAILQANR